MTDKAQELCERLAEIGSDQAFNTYGSGVVVSVFPKENGAVIRADGQEVCFLEFGAGATTNPFHPMAKNFTQETGYEVRKGSYSEQHARQFSEKGFWVWEGEKYTHIMPRAGLWRGEQEIVMRVYEIAKEVFKG